MSPATARSTNKAALTAYRDMLVTVRDRVQKLKAGGRSLAEVTAAKPTADLDAAWGKGFMAPNDFVAIVYNTLRAQVGVRVMNLTRWLVVAWMAGLPAPAAAQTVEITPVGGYRFGGGFFERVTQQEVDLDGAPALGLVVNVPLHDGLFVEALVTHQEAGVTVPESAFCTVAALAHDRRSLSGGRTAGVRDRPPGAPVPHRASRADALRGRRGQRDSFHRRARAAA